MKYDITKSSAPAMPSLGKGTECIQILLSQASKDIREPLVPMLFPVLGAHMSGSEFQYPDLTWKETCGQMANLVAESGGNKGQLSLLVEAICRDFRTHDEEELKKLVEWQKQVKTRSSNKEKPSSGAATCSGMPSREWAIIPKARPLPPAKCRPLSTGLVPRKPLNLPLSAFIGSYPPLSSEPHPKRSYLCTVNSQGAL